MSTLQIGQTVTAIIRTGKYIGEITDIRAKHYLVRILAVMKHPMQGDLHHPKEANPAFFHERKALAFREQTNVPFQMVKPYDEEIPNYEDSLRDALTTLKEGLQQDGSAWALKSLEKVTSLEKDYFK